MTGTILEHLSSRKLILILVSAVCLQFTSFLLFAFFAPSPSNVEQVLGTKCLVKDNFQLAIPRDRQDELGNFLPKNCQRFFDQIDSVNHTVFAFQIPLPRKGIQLDYSRWMYNLVSLLVPEFHYIAEFASEKNWKTQAKDDILIRLNVQLAGRNRFDIEWTLISNQSALQRHLKCDWPLLKPSVAEMKIDCDLIPLFELQSVLYDYYLINVQIQSDNFFPNGIGFYMSDLSLAAINQNGGFTKLWLAVKLFYAFLVCVTLIWFIKRLHKLPRKNTFLERNIIILGISLTFLNLPIELVALFLVRINFIEFFNDVRLGIFQFNLLTFLMIFCGEHLLDGVRRSRIRHYYLDLISLAIAFTPFLILDTAERGVRCIDPFYTIWESQEKFPFVLQLLGLVSSLVYIVRFLRRIYKIYANVKNKQNIVNKIPVGRRLVYQGIVYRFRFLLLTTVLCALVTFIALLASSYKGNLWDNEDYPIALGEHQFEWVSGFIFSVYSVWNYYIILLLFFYAPSHKFKMSNNENSDEIEFDRLNNELNHSTESTATVPLSTISGQTRLKTPMQLVQELIQKINIE